MTSFCSFSMSTSKNSVFLRSMAVRIRPADSDPAAKANNSVAMDSQCFPAAIKSLALSFSLDDSTMSMLDSLAAVSTGAGDTYAKRITLKSPVGLSRTGLTSTNSSIGRLLWFFEQTMRL